jgi:hypothetical protein
MNTTCFLEREILHKTFRETLENSQTFKREMFVTRRAGDFNPLFKS